MESSIEIFIILFGFALIVVLAWKYFPSSIFDPKGNLQNLIDKTKSKAVDVQRLHEIIQNNKDK